MRFRIIAINEVGIEVSEWGEGDYSNAIARAKRLVRAHPLLKARVYDTSKGWELMYEAASPSGSASGEEKAP